MLVDERDVNNLSIMIKPEGKQNTTHDEKENEILIAIEPPKSLQRYFEYV